MRRSASSWKRRGLFLQGGQRIRGFCWLKVYGLRHGFDMFLIFFVFFEQRLILTGLAWRSRICGLRGLGLRIECVTVRFVTPHPSSPPQGTVFYVFGVFGVFGGFGGFEPSRVQGV